MVRTLTLAAGVAFAMTGCQTSASGNDQPARITNPSAASRAALQLTVNRILHTNVTIADSALADSSLLIIQRNPPRNLQNLPAQGRNMDVPIQFRLVANGRDCVLIDQRDGSRHVLSNTSCEAE